MSKMLEIVDAVFDSLCARLGVLDGRDADLISHWQGNGFRIQVTRKADGKALTKFVRADGVVTV